MPELPDNGLNISKPVALWNREIKAEPRKLLLGIGKMVIVEVAATVERWPEFAQAAGVRATVSAPISRRLGALGLERSSNQFFIIGLCACPACLKQRSRAIILIFNIFLFCFG